MAEKMTKEGLFVGLIVDDQPQQPSIDKVVEPTETVVKTEKKTTSKTRKTIKK